MEESGQGEEGQTRQNTFSHNSDGVCTFACELNLVRKKITALIIIDCLLVHTAVHHKVMKLLQN